MRDDGGMARKWPWPLKKVDKIGDTHTLTHCIELIELSDGCDRLKGKLNNFQVSDLGNWWD